MTGVRFELHFIGTGLPDAEIDASNLAAICGSLQELATRVGRWVASGKTLGRLTGPVEGLTRVRVLGLSPGSTRLLLSTEPAQPALEGTDELAEQTDERFWQIVLGAGLGELPDDAPVPVRETTAKMLSAYAATAPEVEVAPKSPALRGGSVRFEPKKALTSAWFATAGPVPEPADGVASGLLEMVDLASGRFRLRDAIGNRIDLKSVADAINAAKLVGTEVTARGAVTRRPDGKMTLTSPTIEPLVLPDGLRDLPDDEAVNAELFAQAAAFDWDGLAPVSLAELVDGAQPYDPVRVEPTGLTDEEWEIFTRAANGE
ncbi:MAG: hypothetical protein LBM66_03635 [Bifidobacteriaceae bacterium]|jgi:hypothetical protein|nr:hypothetical protein [Bifidobacteriaceae bacterium]